MLAGCSPCKNISFGTTALPAGCSPMGLSPGPGRASPILNELENQKIRTNAALFLLNKKLIFYFLIYQYILNDIIH